MNKVLSFFRKEQGWFLMDTVVLCFLLAAFAGALGMYHSSLYSRHTALMRTSAIHIAETQCSYLEEQAYSGKLPEGDIPWLGRPDDLSQDGIPLEVQTTVAPLEPPMQQILIKVTWKLRGREESVQLERHVREHG